MTTAATSLPPDQRPLNECPGCHTTLCPHLRCRTCGECKDCEIRIHQHEDDFRGTSEAMRDAGLRRRMLEWGIPESELDEAVNAMQSLRSDCCPCGNRKNRMESLCRVCWHMLSSDLKQGLYRHMKNGYLIFWREACEQLASRFNQEGGRR